MSTPTEPKPFKMTKFQEDVLAMLHALGATKKSPIRRNGAEFRACMAMYEAGIVGQNVKGFWPIETKKGK
jgi:hypothetical protein